MSKLYCVIAQGDSITGSATRYPFPGLGITSRGDSSSSTLQTTAVYVANGNILFQNLAVSGTRLADSTDNMTYVAQTYSDFIPATKSISPTASSGSTPKPTRKFIFSLLAGSNDGCLSNGTVEAFVANVVAFCAARKAAGFDKVILGTVLPRSEVGTPLSESNRIAYNAIIRAPGWAAANGIDGIFDLGADPIMGDKSNNSNPTYYNSDLVHPTAAGSAILGPIWKATLDAVIATL